MSEQRAFYAVIPAYVRYDNDIPPNAKLLYGEITALCHEKGYCWATNEYFAKLYNCTKQSVSSWISQLKSKGYISIEFEYKEGSKEILYRYIKIFEYPIQKNLNTPIQKNLKDNNIISNNTIDMREKKDISQETEIINEYKKICVSLPQTIILSPLLKSKIETILNKYSFDKIKEVFKKAEESDFLKGCKGFKANFDWLIKDSNFAKVLDGNYDNKAPTKQSSNKYDDFMNGILNKEI